MEPPRLSSGFATKPKKTGEGAKRKNENLFQRMQGLSAFVEHAIPVPVGQRDDELCADPLGIRKNRLRAANGAAVRLLLRALRAGKHLRRRAHGSVEQESHHAILRRHSRLLHRRGTDPFASRPPGAYAHVRAQPAQRPDEHRAAARRRRCHDAADPYEVLSANLRPAILLAVPHHDSQPRAGNVGLCPVGLGNRHRVGSDDFCGSVYGAGVGRAPACAAACAQAGAVANRPLRSGVSARSAAGAHAHLLPGRRQPGCLRV